MCKKYSGVYIGESGFGRTVFISHISRDRSCCTVKFHGDVESQLIHSTSILCNELNLNTHITLNPRYLYGNNRKTPLKH